LQKCKVLIIAVVIVGCLVCNVLVCNLANTVVSEALFFKELFVDTRRGCADMSPRRLWNAMTPRNNAVANVSSAVAALVVVGGGGCWRKRPIMIAI